MSVEDPVLATADRTCGPGTCIGSEQQQKQTLQPTASVQTPRMAPTSPRAERQATPAECSTRYPTPIFRRPLLVPSSTGVNYGYGFSTSPADAHPKVRRLPSQGNRALDLRERETPRDRGWHCLMLDIRKACLHIVWMHSSMPHEWCRGSGVVATGCCHHRSLIIFDLSTCAKLQAQGISASGAGRSSSHAASSSSGSCAQCTLGPSTSGTGYVPFTQSLLK